MKNPLLELYNWRNSIFLILELIVSHVCEFRDLDFPLIGVLLLEVFLVFLIIHAVYDVLDGLHYLFDPSGEFLHLVRSVLFPRLRFCLRETIIFLRCWH